MQSIVLSRSRLIVLIQMGQWHYSSRVRWLALRILVPYALQLANDSVVTEVASTLRALTLRARL